MDHSSMESVNNKPYSFIGSILLANILFVLSFFLVILAGVILYSKSYAQEVGPVVPNYQSGQVPLDADQVPYNQPYGIGYTAPGPAIPAYQSGQTPIETAPVYTAPPPSVVYSPPAVNPPVVVQPECNWAFVYTTCDYDTQRVVDAYKNTCTEEIVYRNYRYEDQKCGYSLDVRRIEVAPPPQAVAPVYQAPQPVSYVQPAPVVQRPVSCGSNFVYTTCDYGSGRVVDVYDNSCNGQRTYQNYRYEDQKCGYNRPAGVVAPAASVSRPAAPLQQPPAVVTPPNINQPSGNITNNNTNINNNNSSATAISGGYPVRPMSNVGQPIDGAYPASYAVNPPEGYFPVTKTSGAVVVPPQLPKTGLPIAALLLAGLLPLGWRLRNYQANRNEEKSSPAAVWSKRVFDKAYKE